MHPSGSNGKRALSQIKMLSARCLVITLTGLLFSLIGSAVHAQNTYRILVLHGVWQQRIWDQQFDVDFSSALEGIGDVNIEVSYQNLGVDRSLSSVAKTRLQQNIQNVIQEQNVDLIVGVLPTAIEFLLEIEEFSNLPQVLVLPESESLADYSEYSSIGIIPSPWRKSIEATIEQILTLQSQTQTIEVIVGNSEIDLIYFDRLQQISGEFSDRVEFRYHVGLAPDSLISLVGGLSEDSSLLLLSYATYGDNQLTNIMNILPQLSQSSAVPMFGISESIVGFGIVGGNVSTVQAYAQAAAELAVSFLDEGPGLPATKNIETSNILDWRQVERWNLPLGLMNTPYSLRYEPNTLWQEYPVVSFAAVNLILFLLAGLLFQAVLLKRSRAAQLIIEAGKKQTRESEARYQLLASNSMDVIWTFDERSRSLTYCSPAIQSLIGYTPEEILTLRFEEVLTAESTSLCLSMLSSSSKGPQVFEIEMCKKDGGTLWCEIAAQRADRQPGGVVEWVGVTRDISKRKEIDAERQALENQVRQNRKIESLGTLAGGIAHDFNNILAVVTGITDLLKDKLVDNEEASVLLNRLMGASEKAKELVRQILTFSRQSKGQKEVINLSSLVHDSLEILEAGIPKHISLNKNICLQQLNVVADSSHIGQVLINIITNAYEAIEGSNGTINISLTQERLERETELSYGRLSAGYYVSIQVEDDGVGMSEQQLENIFDPFYTSKDMGNGLGLSIVHGIVMEHEGGIDIHSVLGEGTTITVFLPLTQESETRVQAKEPEPIKIPPCRILVLDDNKDLLKTLSLMLDRMGHTCVACSNPRQALKLLESEHQDLDMLITDYSMPDLSGIDILDHCSRHYPALPVILSTGYNERITEQIEGDISFAAILNKPYSFRDLNLVLNQITL